MSCARQCALSPEQTESCTETMEEVGGPCTAVLQGQCAGVRGRGGGGLQHGDGGGVPDRAGGGVSGTRPAAAGLQGGLIGVLGTTIYMIQHR